VSERLCLVTGASGYVGGRLVSGLEDWYGLYPLHQIVFAGMLKGIVRAMEHASGSAVAPHRPDSTASGAPGERTAGGGQEVRTDADV